MAGVSCAAPPGLIVPGYFHPPLAGLEPGRFSFSPGHKARGFHTNMFRTNLFSR
jgi:hypothetical protein